MSSALIVVAHPDHKSLTHSVAEELERAFTLQGISSELGDLAVENFDPRFTVGDQLSYQDLAPIPGDVATEQDRINRVDHLVLVFPVYWWSMPALLKGWIDRVFVNGWAFEIDGEGSIEPKLGRLAIHLVPIAGSDCSVYERHGYRASIESQFEHGVVDFCGAQRGGTTYIHDSETKRRAVIVEEVSSLVRDIALRVGQEDLSDSAPSRLL